MDNPSKYLAYPFYARRLTFLEKLLKTVKFLPIKCNICGALTVTHLYADNFRENCICHHCRSFSRQRQVAYVLCNSIPNRRVKTLKEFAALKGIALYNTESGGILHRYLSGGQGYVCSEYFGDAHASGEFVDGVLNEDLMSLSFQDNQFDFVVTTDVFEHIPDPYQAHQEVYRVLKLGGRHIFTLAFRWTEFLDEVRASIDQNEQTVFHKEPMYHIDPIRPEGVLVYTVSSLEMLARLARMGFRTNMHRLYIPLHGIYGQNAIVFEAMKER